MTPRTVAAMAGVGLIHLLFVYGLFSGLAARIVQTLPNVLDVHVFETAQPVRTELPPPVLPDLVQPSIDMVPPPEIHIAAPAAPDAITVLHKTPETPTRAASSVVVPAKAPAVPAPEPARSIAATHTIPPYPPLSRRLGEEGTVQLRIAIATDGRVERAIVESTSGSERLDDAAREWVAKHWRYHPATRDGRPVASETQVKVVFNLKTSR
jgi:protein TonB